MQYVVYQRNESGNLTRAHDRVTLTKTERAAEYPHPEKLLGWAERTVFWARAVGQSTGVAPVSK